MRIGEIARACDVGIGKTSHKAMWHACVDCGQERWVLLRRGAPQSQRCFKCSRDYPGRIKTVRRGSEHWHWQGGRSKMTNGYVEVWVDPSSQYYPMAGKDGYVYEHRLVMAQHLGRCLESDEEVHHKNHDKHDNRPENLEIHSKVDHAFGHVQARHYIRRIAELEAEIRRLRARVSECEARHEEAQTS